MDIITMLWVFVGFFFAFAILGFVTIIAGKDIMTAMVRFFSKKGCDVFIANTNRNISHYYRTPKDGQFKIDKLLYITNPEKTLNLSSEDRTKVMDAITQRSARLKKRIQEYTDKIEELEAMIDKGMSKKEKHLILSQISSINKAIESTKNLLRNKEENYFSRKKPAYFYIEGDPIPKDFYEYYSALDSRIIDNIVSGSISKNDAVRTDEKIDKQKMWITAGAIAAMIAAFCAFRAMSMLETICTNQGLNCGLV